MTGYNAPVCGRCGNEYMSQDTRDFHAENDCEGYNPDELEPCLTCGDPTSNGLLCEHCEAATDEEAAR